jgi:Rrf2 family iron-sulfur cluster assembly transcriptional regulator
MSLIFSRQCEYALQAVAFLALKPEGERISIKTLSRKLKIPYHFLAKIFQELSRKGLLKSLKGPTGGFSLGMPARHITLFQVVEAVDGVEFANRCVMGFPECSGKNPCAVHEQWATLRDGITAMLVTRNIAQIAEEMRKPGFR